MNDHLEILKEARAKVEENWISGRRHEEFFGVHSYCAIGAISASSRHKTLIAQSRARHVLRQVIRDERCPERHRPVRWLPLVGIMAWNDRGMGKRAVLAGFDRAIAREEQRLARLTFVARWWDDHHTQVRRALDTPDPIVDLPTIDVASIPQIQEDNQAARERLLTP